MHTIHIDERTARDKFSRLTDGVAFGSAGTKPYMAPEVIFGAGSGYGHAADWWSLGVTAYELRAGKYPFGDGGVTASLTSKEVFSDERLRKKWSPEFSRFVQALLTPRPDRRLSSLAALRKQKLMANLNFVKLLQRKVSPPFKPKDDGRLHCDPAYELEEMIVEAKPLHKKKKRLLRQQTKLLQQQQKSLDVHETTERIVVVNTIYTKGSLILWQF